MNRNDATISRPIAVASLALLSLALFLPSLRGAFVWDDHALIAAAGDDSRTGLLSGLIAPYWTPASHPQDVATYVRPVTTLSFRIQEALFGPSPAWFHLFNVLCHVLNVWMVFAITDRMTRHRRASVMAAAFFALYPLQVEPVAWISGRTDLLACLFGLAALLTHRRARGLDRWSAGAGLLLLLSIGSKEVGWAFLPLAVWQARIPQALDDRPVSSPKAGLDGRPREPRTPVAATAMGAAPRRWIPVAAAALLGVTVRLASLKHGAMPPIGGDSPPWTIPLRAATSAGHYLLMLLWPWNPSVLPAGRALAPPSSPLLWAGLFTMLSVPIVAWRLRTRDPVISFGLGWVALALVPVLNIIPLSAPSPVAERFWYVPLAGMAILVARGLDRLLAWAARSNGKMERGIRGAILSGMSAAILACCLVSAWRIPEWRTDLTLWEAELSRHGLQHPLCARNLGQARLQAGDRQGAEEVWSAALAQGLGGGTIHYYDIGVEYARLLLDEGRIDQAHTLSGRLLELSPPEPARDDLLDIFSKTTTPR